MENHEPKSSKAIMTFGILVLGSALITVFLFLISMKNPDFAGKALFMFAMTSMFGVAFQIYMKEFRVKGNWKELPIAFRFIWWTIFVANTLNFMDYAIETFIL
ncbi:hypothetical protein [Priestia megaterium]|uniref:hypothetical protein n=1 Tax=Priestia megaterium TaxID=1404 RepID=UPI002E2090F3|nr:hypothetical protein [Priestia megaterium]